MNKVYKIVWSKAKNCYVVASELAKSHTKAPAGSVISKTVVAGVLVSLLSFGAVLPSFVYAEEYAEAPIHNSKTETIIEFHKVHDSVPNTIYSNTYLPDDAIFVYTDGNRNNGTLYLNGSAEFTKYKSLINKIDSVSQWLGQYHYSDGDSSILTSLYGFGTSNGFGTYDTQYGRYYIPGSVTLSNVDSISNSVVNGGIVLGSVQSDVTFTQFSATHSDVEIIQAEINYTGESDDSMSYAAVGKNNTTGAIEIWAYNGRDESSYTDARGKVYTMAGGSGGSGSDPNAIYNMTASGNTITYTKGNGSTGSVTLAGGSGGSSSLGGPFVYYSDTADISSIDTDTPLDAQGRTGEFPIELKDKNNLDYGGMKMVQFKNFHESGIGSYGLEHFLMNGLGFGGSDTYLGMKVRTDGTTADTLIHGLGDSILLGTDDFSLIPMGGKTVGIGSDAKPLAVNSVAFGANSSVASNATNSVALGSNSVANEANVVSVGNGTSNRRIVNLADAINNSDAVTLGQMNSYITPASNGQFIRTTNTGGQNFTALDTAAKNSVVSVTVEGNMLVYHRGDNTSVSVALPTGGTQQAGNNKSRVTTVGSVTAFASNSTPDGYLLCDGRAVSRTKYADLFAKIGTTYGAGNGSTTFNLPNLVNRFVEGSNASGQYIEAGLPNITGKTGGSGVNSNSPAADGAFYKYGTGLGVDDHDYDNHMVAFDASRSNAIYGKSNTVQPEALKMQYYIKVDNSGSGEMPYVGINSTDGGVNEWGDGAIGTNSIAIGKGTSAATAGSIAIGGNAKVTGNNSVVLGYGATSNNGDGVAVGHQALAAENNAVAVGMLTKASATNAVALGDVAEVRGVNSVAIGSTSYAGSQDEVSFGHKAGDPSWQNGQTYTTALTRKLTNITDGSADTDAATYGQMHRADNALSLRIGRNENDGHYVKKSDTNNLTKNVYTLDTTLFNTNNALAAETQNRADADVLLSNRIGSLSSNGNYIRTSEDLSTNVQLLDAQIHSVQNNLDAETEERVAQVNAINNRIGTLDNNGDYVDTNDTVFQNLMNLENAIKSTNGNFDNMVSYDSETFDKVTLKGEDGTTIDNVKNGMLSVTSKEAVNGSQLYMEQQARINADEALSNRIGSISTNGNYIQTGKSVYQNLQLLDDSIKSINTTMEDVVSYDSSNHTVVTLNGNGGTKLTNLRPASLSSTSTDAVIGAQLYATNENIKGMTADITRNKNNIRDLNTSVTAALSSVGSTSNLVDVLNGAKADASLNNLTVSGKQVIANAAINAVQEYMALQQNNYVPPVSPMMYSTNSNALTVTNAGNGSLHVGEGSYVNGTSSIAIGVGNQVNANNSGAFGDPSIINADASYVLGNDDTINTGDTGSFLIGNDSISNAKGGLSLGSNNTLKETAENSIALGNNITITGKNSVALGSGSNAVEDNVVSVGSAVLKRKITNVLEGNLSAGSTDVVTGSQLFVTNEKVDANTSAIAQKADVNASNIDTVAWANKLGTGKVQADDENLVTGGAVYDAMTGLAVSMVDSMPVQATNEAIFIGADRPGNVITVQNKDGENRVITGIATNPEDVTSAANVGYVNAVGDSIMNAVNNSFGQMDTKMNKMGANAAAMASLTPASFEGDEKWSLSAGVGNYKGETAGAVGAFYRPAENVLMNVRGSFGNNENMVGAAVSVSLSKGDIPGVTKRQLANKVNKLENVVLSQNQQITEMRVMMEEMKKQLENK